MSLWLEWFRCVASLRPACARRLTFLWMTLALASITIRSDRAGVTSLVRASWLAERCYDSLLHLFHTKALDLGRLTRAWVAFVLRSFEPVRIQGQSVFVADGLKVPKEGRKMPAVKKLHQESENNSKPTFIFGHSFQAIGLLVQAKQGQVSCVPLASRIHEGVVFSNRDHRTLLDKLATLFLSVAQHNDGPALLVADAYYASRKIIEPLLHAGHHLVTRAKTNCVGYHPAPQPKKRRPGRPRIYGTKVRLKQLWRRKDRFSNAESPVYGEKDIQIRYRTIDLLWRPVGKMVRFVLVVHPVRGCMILMGTDLSLEPLEIIRIYGYRFKIELSFRQALHTLGTYAYHFWMSRMTPISRRRSGNQHLHMKSECYRQQVRRKIAAYHRRVQLGCIAQGLLQYLAIHFTSSVWNHFRSWLRTMNPAAPPSEAVVAQALRATFPEFLLPQPHAQEFTKFLWDKIDWNRCPALRLAG